MATIKELINEYTEQGMTKHKAQIEVGKRVKKLMNSGKSSKEVAEELGINESSVRSFRAKFNEE